jgi:polyphosphate kinase
MNSLVDADVVAALYAAAHAGVEVDLLIRGICCLRPGIPGVSDKIRVHAVVDRFLEHSRIFHFANGGVDEVYLSSADWMPRNFRRRVEVMWPILDESLRRRVIDEILGTMSADTAKDWLLHADGRYVRAVPPKDTKPSRSQLRFMEAARERARETEPLRSRQLTTARAPGAEMEKLRKRGKRKRKDRRRADD